MSDLTPAERYPEPPDDFLHPPDEVDAPRFLDRLGDDLEGVIRRGSSQPERRTLPAVAAVLALVALGVVGLLVLSADDAPASVTIEESTDEVVITSTAGPVDVEEVLAELEAAGVAATATEVPTSERFEGHVVGWIAASFDSEVRADDTDGDGVIDRVVVPRGFEGRLELQIGAVDASPVVRPPLLCGPFLGEPVADVREQLDGLFPDARWFVDLTDSGGGLEETALDAVSAELVIGELALVEGSPLLVFARPADLDRQLVCVGGDPPG